MQIGGFFCYDNNLQISNNDFINNLGDDYKYLLSGRCAIYYCLQDLMLKDKTKVAYLPAYTCETVISNYVKANYTIYYYDINEKLEPIFEDKYLSKISLLHICGYYGFKTYDDTFVQKCFDKGIAILEDTTHSPFSSNGFDKRATYFAGSLRKWIAVECGGYAIKNHGQFQIDLLPVNNQHALARQNAMLDKAKAIEENNVILSQDASDRFWAAEMNLRQMFDSFASNEHSIEIMEHFKINEHKKIRRANYQFLLDNLKCNLITPVFNYLDEATVPSHFSVYANNRAEIQEYLNQNGIHTSVYWPQPPMIKSLENYPQAKYIYEHIFSIPCDQRYSQTQMNYICEKLNILTQ